MKDRFPSRREINRVLKLLENVPGTRIIPKDAPLLDRLKHAVCRHFVVHLNNHKITQRELAKLLGIDEALVSKFVHYRFDEFTLDRLIGYLLILFPKADMEIIFKNVKGVA